MLHNDYFAALPDKAPDFDFEKMLELGCHFGHQAQKWHPQMADWIYAEKDGVHIFDLVKTVQQLKYAYNYAYELGKTGKVLVFVGTKRQAKDIVKAAAIKAKAMYITSRWLGGMLTNWPQVSHSLKRMTEIEEGLKVGKFDAYTKYERNQLDKEATRLGRFFDGVRELKKQPDALFVVDPGHEKVAVLEALAKGVPMMGLVDTNTDPRSLDLPIGGNDDAANSIQYFVEQVAAGYAAGLQAKTA